MKHNKHQSQASKKHLILSQYQCDVPLLPACHLPLHHLPLHHVPRHHNVSVLSSEMKENRMNCVQNVTIALVFSIPEHVVLTFRIKMASPQKLLNISQ